MSAPGLSLMRVRKRTVAKARSWPSAGASSANFIVRQPSFRSRVPKGRFRASNSESWRARLGHQLPLTKGNFLEWHLLKIDKVQTAIWAQAGTTDQRILVS